MAHGSLSILQSGPKMECMNRLGALVREAREQRDLKVYQLAEEIGKQPSFVSRLENGVMKELPSPEDLGKISDVLGVPVAELVYAAGYPIIATKQYAYDAGVPPVIRDILSEIEWSSPRNVVRVKMMLETIRDTQRPQPPGAGELLERERRRAAGELGSDDPEGEG